MAVRLSVLVLRPPGGGSTWHAHSDDLLGHLLGRPGFDVTLLERLPTAGEDSTETLALESIGGHIACLAWQDARDVIADLDRAGRPMRRRPHAGDPDCDDSAATGSGIPQPPQSARQGRMYFFDMRSQGRTEAVLGALQKLLQTLQVPTFQIGSPTKQAASGRAVQATQRPVEISQRPESLSRGPVSVFATPDPSTEVPSGTSAKTSTAATRSEPRPLRTDGGATSSQSDALDRLVDELDAFDK